MATKYTHEIKELYSNTSFDGITPLSNEELIWVSGGNRKDTKDNNQNSDIKSVMSEVISRSLGKIGGSGSASFTIESKTPGGSVLKLSITIEVSAGSCSKKKGN